MYGYSAPAREKKNNPRVVELREQVKQLLGGVDEHLAQSAMERLPGTQARRLNLFLSVKSLEEIGKKEGVSSNSCKSSISRAIENLEVNLRLEVALREKGHELPLSEMGLTRKALRVFEIIGISKLGEVALEQIFFLQQIQAIDKGSADNIHRSLSHIANHS